MGVLRGRVLQPHGQSYFNDAALATLSVSYWYFYCVLLGHALHLNLCANTAFQVNYSAMGVLRDRVLQPHGHLHIIIYLRVSCCGDFKGSLSCSCEDIPSPARTFP